jgi:hypothetical protein
MGFLKGQDQISLLFGGSQDAESTTSNEQVVTSGALKAFRFVDTTTKEVVYICSDGSLCAPSIIQLFTSSKTDEVVSAKANQRLTAELYGFMVPWENTMMFKTNTPKPEGKDPGGGAACSIVSNVSGHRKKLTELGDILARYSGGNRFDLTDAILSGARKLTGAPNFCALTEIVMRWMDKRRSMYGGLRYFYRPVSSYYSKHKGKK